MATAPAPAASPSYETVADLRERLGDIPPERIRLQPSPGTATDEDVLTCKDRIGRLCELVDGVLVEKPVGYYESHLAVVLIGFLQAYLEDHDLGIVLGEAGLVRTEPRRVRAADVAFLSWDHFPNRLLPPGGILDLVPDLAVEILSPGNTREEMRRKRQEYFAGGTQLVWEVDPDKRTVRVYTSPQRSTLVKESQTLDGGDVLPGFTLPVRRWFARAGKRRPE